jgi:hypothetical protein
MKRDPEATALIAVQNREPFLYEAVKSIFRESTQLVCRKVNQCDK